MSVFESEIRHKTSPEDQLTSSVFGALAIMDKRSVLLPFLLRLIGGQDEKLRNLCSLLDKLTDDDRENLEVKLWKRFGSRQYWEGYPDVYIERIPGCLIAIEVKVRKNTVSSDQIVRQYRAIRGEGRGEGQVFYLLLTNDDTLPDKAINEARTQLPDASISWCRWTHVWRCLSDMRDDKVLALGGTDRGLLDNVIRLLEDKGMCDFTGIKSEWFTEQIAESVEYLNKLFVELQHLALSLRQPEGGEIGIAQLGLEEQDGKDFFRIYDVPKGKPEPTDNQRMLPRWIVLAYRDKLWRRRKNLSKAGIYLSCDIGRGFRVEFCKEEVTHGGSESKRLQEEAENEGFGFESIDPSKGKADVYVYRDLLELSSAGTESQVLTREQAIEALAAVRDFGRRFYRVADKSRAQTTSDAECE